jgi:hypothetical protein
MLGSLAAASATGRGRLRTLDIKVHRTSDPHEWNAQGREVADMLPLVSVFKSLTFMRLKFTGVQRN